LTGDVRLVAGGLRPKTVRQRNWKETAMDDRERGAAASRRRDVDIEENRPERPKDDFARSMARAEYRRIYWNEQLESDLWQSLERARQRVKKRERELK
jgi:hypothetical protein